MRMCWSKFIMRIQNLLRTLVAASLVMLFVMPAKAYTKEPTYPKREMRAVWCTPVSGCWPSGNGLSLTKQKEEALAIIKDLANFGFNAVYLHMRAHGDRLYSRYTATINNKEYIVYDRPSHYVKNSNNVIQTYTENGVSKDIFDYWIEECHKRGIEVYAWLNPFRVPNPDNNYYDYNPSATERAWIISSGTNYRLDPGLEECQWRIETVCRVLTHNYDIDGIIFDDYFYPEGLAKDSSAPDYKTYQNSNSSLILVDWRFENINKTVQRCQKAVHETKPWVIFAIGPAGGAWKGLLSTDGIPNMCNYKDEIHNVTTGNVPDNNWDKLYADPIKWMREKWIDFLSPQLYWRDNHGSNPFSGMSSWYALAAEHFKVPVFVSQDCNEAAPMSLIFSNASSSSDIVIEYIRNNRENNRDNNYGNVFYSSKNIAGGTKKTVTDRGAYFGDLIKNACYQYPAAVPELNSANATNPGKISNLKQSGSDLTWTAMDNMRYMVYAIPSTMSELDVADSKFGNIKAEYLVQAPNYTNSASISGKTSGYWYAVAPLDRYGVEWPYTTCGNVPASQDAEVSLSSPANGATATWSQTFKYSGTSGANFTFELAEDATFSKIVKTQSSTATSTTVDFSGLKYSTTYYWRVSASKTGYRNATSETRTIISPTPSPMSAVSLTSPANGVTANENQKFTWSDPSNADSYIVEFSKYSNFSFIAKKVTTTSLSTTVYMTEFDSNTTYYWRVRSTKKLYSDATSTVRSFITPETDKLASPPQYYPRFGETVTGDFCFTILDVGADINQLEVATDENFSQIFYTGNAGWITVENCLQYSVPLNLFPAGRYYWRVVVSKDGYTSNVSTITDFVVGDADNSTSNYVPHRDPTSYTSYGNLMLTNLWVRDASHNPIAYGESETRDMAARGDRDGDQDGRDIVYIANRGSKCLNRFDGSSGEELSALSLSFDSEYHNDGYCLNGIFIDNDNNLFVHNLRTTVGANPGLIAGTVSYGSSLSDGDRCLSSDKNDLVLDGTTANAAYTYVDVKIKALGTKTLSYNPASGIVTVTPLSDWDEKSGGTLRISLNPNFKVTAATTKTSFVAVQYNTTHRIQINFKATLTPATIHNYTIAQVDLSTGATSTVFAKNPTGRIDHGYLLGSVESGNYTVFGIGTQGNPRSTYVYRWIVNNGDIGTEEVMYIGDYGPAPRIVATSNDNIYIDGYNNKPQRFTFKNQTNSAVSSSESSNISLLSKGNGMAIFEHNGDSYMVMSNGSCNGSNADNWKIFSGSDFNSSFSGASNYWTFPTAGIGSVAQSSTDYAMPVSVIQRNAQGNLTRAGSAQTSTTYTYSSGNGLAAYTMNTRVVTGVDEIESENFNVNIDGDAVDFGCEVDAYAIYDTSGRLVQAGSAERRIYPELPSGIYILRVNYAGMVHTERIALR